MVNLSKLTVGATVYYVFADGTTSSDAGRIIATDIAGETGYHLVQWRGYRDMHSERVLTTAAYRAA